MDIQIIGAIRQSLDVTGRLDKSEPLKYVPLTWKCLAEERCNISLKLLEPANRHLAC